MPTTENTTHITLRTRAKVLPGKRLELMMPELEEGAEVEIEIRQRSANGTAVIQPRKFRDVVEFLDSLPDRGSSPEDRARIEAEIEEIKNSWGE